MAPFSRSLLLINYFTAELTKQAIGSARQASSSPLVVVVVDNSTDSDEFGRLQASGADVLLQAERNLGYAGGINFGARHCRGDVLIVCNPDVIFRHGCIDRLVEQLEGEVAMSGPRLTWDDGDRWLLPPAELATREGKLSQALGTRWSWWRQRRDCSRFRARERFWSLTAASWVRAISGAVMALRHDIFEQLSGFDERFHLYFEEIDFMRRLRGRGLRIRYLPDAVCRHLYNQSAARSPSSASQFRESERTYQEKWNGPWLPALVDRIAAKRDRGIANHFVRCSADRALVVPDPPRRYVIEASPLSNFDAATGHFPVEREVVFPSEIWSCYRGTTLYLRVIERETARVVERYRFDKTEEPR